MNRRRLLQLGATLFAAPAIVRAESLMRVCVVPVPAVKMTVTQKMANELLRRDFSVLNAFGGKFTFDLDGWESREPGGIITVKRPNFSETRLWPEDD